MASDSGARAPEFRTLTSIKQKKIEKARHLQKLQKEAEKRSLQVDLEDFNEDFSISEIFEVFFKTWKEKIMSNCTIKAN